MQTSRYTPAEAAEVKRSSLTVFLLGTNWSVILDYVDSNVQVCGVVPAVLPHVWSEASFQIGAEG